MRYWTKDRILELLDRVIANEDLSNWWDDFSYSSLKGDVFERYWGEKIVAVSELYPPRRKDELFNVEQGVEYLKRLKGELLDANEDRQ